MSNLDALFGSFDTDALTEQLEKEKADKQASGIYGQLAQGLNILRVMPPRPGQRLPFLAVAEHGIEIPGAGYRQFACPRTELGAPCPVCLLVSKLMQTGNAMDADRAGQIGAKTNHYVNGILRTKGEGGVLVNSPVQIFKIPYKVHQFLADLKSEMGMDYSHPIKGMDIYIKKEGEKKNTKYPSVTANPHGVTQLAATEEEMRQMLEASHDLRRGIKLYDENGIRELLGGADQKTVKGLNPLEYLGKATGGTRALDMVNDKG